MRPRYTLFLALFMVLALPAANAMAAPKARIKFQTKVSVVQENTGDGLGHVVVTRAKRLADTVTVNYTTSSTTATAGASCAAGVDFQPVAGSLTFGPGETSKEILVPICDDAVVEGGEFVSIALTRPVAGVVVTGGGHQLAISDNDGPARLAFATTDTLIFENNGPAPLSVIRLGDPTLAVSVDYTMNDGTATAGDDYNQVNGTLSFPTIASDPVAATMRTINVGLVNNGSAEADENMNVSLSNPRETVSGNALAAGSPTVSTVTILDDDIPASIAFLNPLATIGEADGDLTVTLRRSGAPDDSVSASYTTVDGEALAGSDYTSTVFDVNEPWRRPAVRAGRHRGRLLGADHERLGGRELGDLRSLALQHPVELGPGWRQLPAEHDRDDHGRRPGARGPRSPGRSGRRRRRPRPRARVACSTRPPAPAAPPCGPRRSSASRAARRSS